MWGKYKSEITLTRVTVSVFLVFLIILPFSCVIPDANLSVDVSEANPIETTAEHTSSVKEWVSDENILLLNSTAFDAVRELTWPLTYSPNSEPEQPGPFRFHIPSPMQYESKEFGYRVVIAIQEYASLQIRTFFELVQGRVNVSLRVWYTGTEHHINYYETQTQFVSLELNGASSKTSLTIDSPISEILANDSYWIRYVYIFVRFDPLEDSEAIFHSVEVDGTSTSPLCPLTVDIRDSEGTSLFQHPSTSLLRQFPALNITSNNRSVLFIPNTTNDTLYVSPGSYRIIEGWFLDWLDEDDFVQFWVSDVELHGSEGAWLGFEHRMPRLFINVQPNVPKITIILRSLNNEEYHDPYWVTMAAPHLDFLYLPPVHLELSLSIIVERYRTDIYYKSWIFQERVDFSGSTDFTLGIEIPAFTYFGLIITPGDVLVLGTWIFFVSLIFMEFARLLIPNWREGLEKRSHSLPMMLLILSSFLPWYQYKDSLAITHSIFPAFLTVFHQTSGSTIMLSYINSYLSLLLATAITIIGIIYWVPILGTRFIRHNFSCLIVLLASTLISAWAILYAPVFSWNIGLGLVLSLCALPTWLLIRIWVNWGNNRQLLRDYRRNPRLIFPNKVIPDESGQ
ncbi:MAG: hypothetical protein ACFFEF_14475 [Candidatus Thorarchaeota archaeon]